MSIKIYNTLTKKKEIFRPFKARCVRMFVCGITPYDFAHIGHARTYINFDVIVKYLRQQGYSVFYLQNITDIDDKIIKRAREKKVSLQKLAKEGEDDKSSSSAIALARLFEKEYLKDMKDLRVDSIKKYARATEHIKEIISQVKRLLKKGYAYQIKDGIYYDISKFKKYGKLSRRTVLQAEDAVSRIDESKEKRNKGDFALWKFSKAGEPSWPSPFGHGRPGWHIEDTAITEKYFGPQYDIHGGAKDLIFPHHEAEIAQMEAISGKSPMVKYWMHSGFLTVGGRKMAKSLGNFITIKDFLKKQSPRLLRFLMIKTHYRSPINYNEKLLSQTKKELERIDEFINKISQNRSVKISRDRGKFRQRLILDIKESERDFDGAMEDDFNASKAIAVIFNLVNKGNSLIAKNKLSTSDTKKILNFLKKADKIFGFIFWEKPKEKIPASVLNLVKLREKYRQQRNWQKADEVRKKIKSMGYWIEDTKERPKIKKI